jgi:hypothetical protein
MLVVKPESKKNKVKKFLFGKNEEIYQEESLTEVKTSEMISNLEMQTNSVVHASTKRQTAKTIERMKMKLAMNADSRVSKEKYVETDAEEEEMEIGRDGLASRPTRRPPTFSVSFAEEGSFS